MFDPNSQAYLQLIQIIAELLEAFFKSHEAG